MSRANPNALDLPIRNPDPRRTSIAGERFGRLVAAVEVAPAKSGNRQWRCRCDCGRDVVVTMSSLRAGHTRSCGCLHSEVVQAAPLKHGQAHRGRLTPEYRAWRAMLRRCETPGASHYAAYGGAGIGVCAGWHDPAAFIRDMGPKPTLKHSLDRIDNARGYDCGKCSDCLGRGATPNCRWATPVQQVNNRRVTSLVDYAGRRVPLAELARELGVNYWRLRSRLKRGLSVEAALADIAGAAARGAR
jgi:hypothetical protein